METKEENEETEEAEIASKARIFVFDHAFTEGCFLKPTAIYLRQQAKKEGIDLIFIQNKELYDIYLKNRHIKDNSVRYAIVMGNVENIVLSKSVIENDFNYLEAPVIDLKYDSNAEQYIHSLKKELFNKNILVRVERDIEMFQPKPPSLENLARELELPPEQN